jgi:GGDEF domain-containing protein
MGRTAGRLQLFKWTLESVHHFLPGDVGGGAHDVPMQELELLGGEFARLEEDVRLQVVELGRREASLARLADHLRTAVGVDPLTGLDTAPRFEQRLAQELKRAARGGHPTAVAVIELCGWQRLDAEASEAAGLLTRAAEAIRDEFRDIDTVALLRGARFAALLPMCDSPSAVAAASRVASRLSELCTLAVSAGVACTADTSGWDLVEVAEAALGPVSGPATIAAGVPAQVRVAV